MRKYDYHCLEFVLEFDRWSSMLTRDKLEIRPVWGKLEIKLSVRTKETEAIIVLIVQYHVRLVLAVSTPLETALPYFLNLLRILFFVSVTISVISAPKIQIPIC